MSSRIAWAAVGATAVLASVAMYTRVIRIATRAPYVKFRLSRISRPVPPPRQSAVGACLGRKETTISPRDMHVLCRAAPTTAFTFSKLQPSDTLICAGATAGGLSVPPESYPDVHRGELVNDLHGTKVADPYRWLEQPDSYPTRTCMLPFGVTINQRQCNTVSVHCREECLCVAHVSPSSAQLQSTHVWCSH